VCGSGAGAFDIFDQAVLTESGTAWFDENDNLTKETFLLAIPGEFSSATDTLTAKNIYRTPTGQFVLQAVARQVFNFDQSQLISSHGPNAFVAAFYEGDPHAFDQNLRGAGRVVPCTPDSAGATSLSAPARTVQGHRSASAARSGVIPEQWPSERVLFSPPPKSRLMYGPNSAASEDAIGRSSVREGGEL
jgi:hypothetical protein